MSFVRTNRTLQGSDRGGLGGKPWENRQSDQGNVELARASEGRDCTTSAIVVSPNANNPQVVSTDSQQQFPRESRIGADSVRVALPLFQTERDGSTPVSALQLIYERCSREHAARLNRLWHSRLPEVEWQTMQFAFHARYGDYSFAVAMWSAPVTNMLPSHWLELRRLAIAEDAPRFTASSFLGWMVRWLRKNEPHREKAISYQDCAVHSGTIYKASGWTVGRTGLSGDWNHKSRFRPVKNGIETNQSEKRRWEVSL